MEPYPNPPIREALIDIKIDPLTPASLGLLEGLHSQLSVQYPVKKIRHRWAGSVETQEDRLLSAAQKYLGPDGYMFVSSDEQQIVQYRLDGFTFNRLRPYPRHGWPVVREEASRLWDLYVSAVNPARAIGLGLRYINEINIPLPDIHLEEYLTEPPRIPQGLPQTLDQFLTRLVLPFPELDARAIITQSLGTPHSSNIVSVILDIDVLTDVPRKADSATVWSVLDRFRDIKNRIFKSSLSPKTEELFQ